VETIAAGPTVAPEMLLKLINSLEEGYLANASFLMNRGTLSAIQSLQDKTGRFVWQQSLTDPLQQSIFGIPIIISSHMPEIGADNLSIVIGDFKSAYKIVDRSGINLLRDPYTDKPFVRFYAVKRVGGDVVNPDAIKFAKFSGE
jgi:HK97 family phage major capsid protein